MRYLVTIIKLVAGLAIVFYLVRAGHFDLTTLSFSSANSPWLVAAFALIVGQVLFAAWRWQIILQGAGIQKGFGTLVRLTWAGQFVGSILLGTVGSDLVRIYYSVREFSKDRAMVSLAILIDRGIGMICLLLFSLLMVPLASDALVRAVEKQLVIVAGILVIGLLGLVLTWIFRKLLIARLQKVPWAELRSLIRSPSGRKAVIGLFALCFIGQIGMVAIFYCVLQGLGQGVPFAQLLWMTPVVLLAMAVPITPSGIGTGQAVFAYLFVLAGVGTSAQGSNAATTFQLLGFAVNAVGLIPFLTIRRAMATDPTPPQAIGEAAR